MKLFMFYIGGSCGASNIELHDVRFAAGETPEDCYDELRRQWWGDPTSLHLDCWGAVEQADGYDVTLSREPAATAEGRQLFFLNMGGYDPTQFEELHKNIVLVGVSAHEVMVRAMKDIRAHFKTPHRDAILEIENHINLNEAMVGQGWHIHLSPAALFVPFAFTCQYRKINS